MTVAGNAHGPAEPELRRGTSPRRIVAALGLASWAGLFWYLLLSGEWTLFLAARVNWLVPVAAILFTLAAVGALLTSRVPAPQSLTPRDGGALAVIVGPVLLVLLVPMGTLTTFAAERRTGFSLSQGNSVAEIQAGRPLSFQQLAGAAADEDVAAALAEREGETVELVGLVMAPTDAGFTLTRFVVSCCVVDATVAEVPVRGGASGIGEGSWARVIGQLAADGSGAPAIVNPDVAPAEQPDPPYLYPQ